MDRKKPLSEQTDLGIIQDLELKLHGTGAAYRVFNGERLSPQELNLFLQISEEQGWPILRREGNAVQKDLGDVYEMIRANGSDPYGRQTFDPLILFFDRNLPEGKKDTIVDFIHSDGNQGLCRKYGLGA